jgi:hypothetical protein
MEKILCACGCGTSAPARKKWAWGHKPLNAMQTGEAARKSGRIAARADRATGGDTGRAGTYEIERKKATAAVHRTLAVYPLTVGTYRDVLHQLRIELERIDRARAIVVLAIGACEKLTENGSAAEGRRGRDVL